MSDVKRPVEAEPPISEAAVLAILRGPKKLGSELAQDIIEQSETDQPLADPSVVSEVIGWLAMGEAVDPYQTVVKLGCSSYTVARLLASSTGVPSGYRLFEHTQAVLGQRNAQPSRHMFNTDESQILDTALLLGGIGKPLAIAVSGSRRAQEDQNVRVASNIISALPEHVIGEDGKKLVPLLIGHDIVGRAVRGKLDLNAALSTVDQLRKQCPAAYRNKLPKFLGALYLADATAYTWQAQYRNGKGRLRHCLPALNFVFKKEQDGSFVFRRQSQQRIFEALTRSD